MAHCTDVLSADAIEIDTTLPNGHPLRCTVKLAGISAPDAKHGNLVVRWDGKPIRWPTSSDIDARGKAWAYVAMWDKDLWIATDPDHLWDEKGRLLAVVYSLNPETGERDANLNIEALKQGWAVLDLSQPHTSVNVQEFRDAEGYGRRFEYGIWEQVWKEWDEEYPSGPAVDIINEIRSSLSQEIKSASQ